MLNILKPAAKIEEQKDVIVTFGAWETDVYPLTIEMAYIDVTKSGAWMFNVNMIDTETNKRITYSECLVSAKSGTPKNTYTDKKTGEEKMLPGYVKTLNLMQTLVDPNIADLTGIEVEPKAIKLRIDGEEQVVEKPVVVDLLGKNLHAGIQKQVLDKFKKNEATGQFDIPNGTKEENTFEKIFDEDKRTLQEIRDNAEPKFASEWQTAYKGKTRNRAKNKPVTAQAGTAGAPTAPNTPATPKLSW